MLSYVKSGRGPGKSGEGGRTSRDFVFCITEGRLEKYTYACTFISTARSEANITIKFQ